MTEHEDAALARIENELVAEFGEELEVRLPESSSTAECSTHATYLCECQNAGLSARLTLSTRGTIRRFLPEYFLRLTGSSTITGELAAALTAQHPERGDNEIQQLTREKLLATAKYLTRVALRSFDLQAPLQIAINSEFDSAQAVGWHNPGLGLPLANVDGFAIQTSDVKSLLRERERIERKRNRSWPKLISFPRGGKRTPVVMIELRARLILHTEYERIAATMAPGSRGSEFVIPELAFQLPKLVSRHPNDVRERIEATLLSGEKWESRLHGRLRRRLFPEDKRQPRLWALHRMGLKQKKSSPDK